MDIQSITQCEQIIRHLVTITETTLDLGDKIALAEKHICLLRSLTAKEARTVITLKSIKRAILQNTLKIVRSNLYYLNNGSENDIKNNNLKFLHERLNKILEKESEAEDMDFSDLTESRNECSMHFLAEKIQSLELKKRVDTAAAVSATAATFKLHKADIDIKFPESCSRESLLEFESRTSLPPVPEDAFTSFMRPARSYSLSSFKNMKKMKHTLKQYDDFDTEEPKAFDISGFQSNETY
ncbi:hypothetical protein J437_LFUL009480 [Ladona fulva]|uniref:Uncharacterized protein n=1 Tax=Ladona fulva TaxID=123851 RepID=A0A8K0NXM4_LADFU|nr:hypothetical protein J437_LFUL009480 [Ladona fulva]